METGIVTGLESMMDLLTWKIVYDLWKSLERELNGTARSRRFKTT